MKADLEDSYGNFSHVEVDIVICEGKVFIDGSQVTEWGIMGEGEPLRFAVEEVTLLTKGGSSTKIYVIKDGYNPPKSAREIFVDLLNKAHESAFS